MSRKAHVKRAKLMRDQMRIGVKFNWCTPWKIGATSRLNDHRRYLANGGKFLRRKTVLRVQRQLSYYQGR